MHAHSAKSITEFLKLKGSDNLLGEDVPVTDSPLYQIPPGARKELVSYKSIGNGLELDRYRRLSPKDSVNILTST